MGVQILTHQPCPDCGSSDALTVYDWGTKCFSCRKSNFDAQNAGLQSLKKDDKAFRFVNGITRTIVDRKLNKNTCEFFGLVEANDQYYFPYCDEDGNLVAYKKRQISDKKFSVEGNWQRGRLFGQHLFPAGQSILTICEGEFDAMSAWQMMGGTGKYAVVSVRNGAGSAIADCKNNYEYIDSFETIVAAD